MEVIENIKIIAFYEFKALESLEDKKARIKEAMSVHGVRGTFIIAEEGYNGMICGHGPEVDAFISDANCILETNISFKASFNENAPFRKIDVKIKPEIVTLRRKVDISLGKGTHVKPKDWNTIITDPETLVLDTRNDYEFQSGTFRGAIDPNVKKFSDLPEYVEKNMDPDTHKKVAMFCTGGIRCEKFAPYLKELGFKEVYQLEGGILKYLEETDVKNSLWEGECFVFDERITVDANLKKGTGPDHSQRFASRKNPLYKDPK